MLGIFPDPYPDEILFSVCSRYHQRLGYRSRESTGWDLFGSAQATVSYDLPGNLSHIVSVLPPNHRYTIDKLVDENTLYPLYGPFLSPERAGLLRNDMEKARGGAIHGRAGINTSRIILEHLRYCPLCVEQDRQTWDETYWHRIHQVSGVEVCPIHNVFLNSSSVQAGRIGTRRNFAPAERVITPSAIRSLNSGDLSHTMLLRLALDFAWLLDQRGLTAQPGVTRNRYLRILFDKKLATHTGQVYTTQLHHAFVEFFSANFLQHLKCSLDRRFTWLRRIVQTPPRGSVQPPLRHLLLMNFLGYLPQDFFALPETRVQPFGPGPWPCLNRTADHFGQFRITNCKIVRKFDPALKPVGHFYCECGFVYCRRGPDLSAEDRYRFSKVQSYGDLFSITVKNMHDSGRLSISTIASRLQVKDSAVQHQLKRSASLASKKKSNKQRGRPSSRNEGAKSSLTKTYRRSWLRAITKNAEAGRTELRSMCGDSYNWLQLNDREWFETNSPKRRTPTGPPQLIDWEKRDAELAVEVKSSANTILRTSGRPIRASATALARKTGALETIQKRAHLLPLTIKAISEVAETPEAYAIRRIKWAMRCFKDENARPSKGSLQIRAAVSPQMLKRPEVNTAFVETLRESRYRIPTSNCSGGGRGDGPGFGESQIL